MIRNICALMAFISLTPSAVALNEGLQCVPYARAISGIEIYGDAHTWWNKAKGRYDRGDNPRVGAILSFKPHAATRLGHISAVRAIVDDRTILVSHANWSRINGKRGHIEDDVKVVDVSKKNDWSEVRVWYQPIGALGGTRYPINGFIYPKKQKSYTDIKASIAKLTDQPISKVALMEYPSQNVNQNEKRGNQHFAQISYKQSNKQDKKKSRKKRKKFNLERSFLKGLDEQSRKEKETARNTQQSNDPIGDLLGQVGP